MSIWFFLTIYVILIYFLVRNEWVCKRRLNLIEDNFALYKMLPSYWTMVFHKFWCWDINGFLPPNFKR